MQEQMDNKLTAEVWERVAYARWSFVHSVELVVCASYNVQFAG